MEKLHTNAGLVRIYPWQFIRKFNDSRQMWWMWRFCCFFCWAKDTLQEINISHLGKRKIIFKYALSGGYVNSLEGTCKTKTSLMIIQFSWKLHVPKSHDGFPPRDDRDMFQSIGPPRVGGNGLKGWCKLFTCECSFTCGAALEHRNWLSATVEDVMIQIRWRA